MNRAAAGETGFEADARPLRRWLRLLVSTRVQVEGASMMPALCDGDRLLVDRLVYRLHPPQRGDIVLLRDPARPGFECIKRIVGLPGERLRLQGTAFSVDDRPLTEPYVAAWRVDSPAGEWRLPPGQYLVLGDNRDFSTDSRSYGPVPRAALRGRVWHCYRCAERTLRL